MAVRMGMRACGTCVGHERGCVRAKSDFIRLETIRSINRSLGLAKPTRRASSSGQALGGPNRSIRIRPKTKPPPIHPHPYRRVPGRGLFGVPPPIDLHARYAIPLSHPTPPRPQLTILPDPTRHTYTHITGIEWFGVDKRVVFTDATEDTSLVRVYAVTVPFRFVHVCLLCTNQSRAITRPSQ